LLFTCAEVIVMRQLLSPLLVLSCGLLACSGGASTDGKSSSTTSQFRSAGGDRFTAYADPYGDGRPNPLAHIQGNVEIFTVSAEDAKDYGVAQSTDVWVSAWGLPNGTTYPAHVHALPCAPPDKGGGHYQNVAGGPADETNEVHLSLASDQGGTAFAEAHTTFGVRRGEAKSIVIHDGLAVVGKLPKLACVDVAF
jgi:hypothetical protein